MEEEKRLTYGEVHLVGDSLGVSFKEYPESPPITQKFWISARDLCAFCKEKNKDAQVVE